MKHEYLVGSAVACWFVCALGCTAPMAAPQVESLSTRTPTREGLVCLDAASEVLIWDAIDDRWPPSVRGGAAEEREAAIEAVSIGLAELDAQCSCETDVCDDGAGSDVASQNLVVGPVLLLSKCAELKVAIRALGEIFDELRDLAWDCATGAISCTPQEVIAISEAQAAVSRIQGGLMAAYDRMGCSWILGAP